MSNSDTRGQDTQRITQETIEGWAAELLRKHNQYTVPVNPVRLAQAQNIKVNNATFVHEDISGMITRNGDNVRILVNADDPPETKRFTIAHEIAHLFLHLSEDGEIIDREGDLDRITTSERSNKETQANMFAAALLMPKDHVEHYWRQFRSVAKLALLFGVPEETMTHRLRALELV
ncbi:MAG: ImmA/IrrE family metallo-endopeptidase [Candidatus Hydrogenedentota bacterium]